MAGLQRYINPENKVPTCSVKKYISIHCNFASAAEAEATSNTYGISVCCKKDLQSAYLDYELLKLDEIYDPELCKPIESGACCIPPCHVVATLEIVEYCLESTNVSATLALIP